MPPNKEKIRKLNNDYLDESSLDIFLNKNEFVYVGINNSFLFSTQKHPKVVAPLINCYKNDIVKLALEHDIPLQFVRSCYAGGEKHCGKCESCVRLKNALIENNDTKYIRELF